jgi:hypothetical protein
MSVVWAKLPWAAPRPDGDQEQLKRRPKAPSLREVQDVMRRNLEPEGDLSDRDALSEIYGVWTMSG